MHRAASQALRASFANFRGNSNPRCIVFDFGTPSARFTLRTGRIQVFPNVASNEYLGDSYANVWSALCDVEGERLAVVQKSIHGTNFD
jgi:hypothetical protein